MARESDRREKLHDVTDCEESREIGARPRDRAGDTAVKQDDRQSEPDFSPSVGALAPEPRQNPESHAEGELQEEPAKQEVRVRPNQTEESGRKPTHFRQKHEGADE